MSKIGFVIPKYDGEKRVAILPQDICRGKSAYSEIMIQSGFGLDIGIDDEAYTAAGCTIADKDTCYSAEYVFSLKLVHPDDYTMLRHGSKIIGWMHPNGSGRSFHNNIARQKNITLFDIDSVYPRVYRPDGSTEDITTLPKHFFWENSYIAGMASIELGLRHAKLDSLEQLRIAILGCGNVSQGAFHMISSLGGRPRMFHRKTLDIFKEQVDQFDLIINGIEVDQDGLHIIDCKLLERTKRDVFIIDAAADAGRAIEGTEYQTLAEPLGIVHDRCYLLVNNAPTVFHEQASMVISRVVSSLFLAQKYF